MKGLCSDVPIQQDLLYLDKNNAKYLKPSNYVTFVAFTPTFLIKPGRNIMIVATSISFRGPSRFTTAPMFNIMQSVSITSVQSLQEVTSITKCPSCFF